jgi:hypothetical protein
MQIEVLVDNRDGFDYEYWKAISIGGGEWFPPYECLEETEALALGGLLRPFTATPNDAWFMLWDGYGDLGRDIGNVPRAFIPSFSSPFQGHREGMVVRAAPTMSVRDGNDTPGARDESRSRFQDSGIGVTPGRDRNHWSSDPLIGRCDQPTAQGCRTSLAEWLSLGDQASGRGGGAAGRTAGWLARRTTIVCAALSPNR